MSQVTVPFSAQGTRFLVRIAGVWTDITQIQKLTGPGVQTTIVDVSTLSSLGGFKEKAALMNDPTPVNGTIVWNPADASHKYLQDSNASYPKTLERFMEIAADTNQKTVLFSGYVTKFEPDLTTNAVGMFSFEVTPTGQPTIYYGSSPA